MVLHSIVLLVKAHDVELIVHPGENGVSQSTVGLISLATIGLAVAYLVQLVISTNS